MKRLFYLIILSFLSALAMSAADFSGKRIAVLGDSMTWIGGDSCSNPKGWTHHFVKITNPASVGIYARSGATWTNTRNTKGDTSEYSEVITDENVIYSQACRLIDDSNNKRTPVPDLIILYAGANDAWFASRRPGIFDSVPDPSAVTPPSECTSLKSSVILVGKMLKKHFPKSRIVLMTPVEMTKVSPQQVRKVADIIASAGKELGLEVLRADKNVNIRHFSEKSKLRHTSDGVHTNPSGARLIGEFVAAELLK